MTRPPDPRAALEAKGRRLLAELAAYLDSSGSLAIVKAPPGSGKTHLLLHTVSHCVRRGLRVAVATQTNTQADDICRRMAQDHRGVPAYRFLAAGGDDPGLPASVRVVRQRDGLPASPSVSVGTTAKWALTTLDEPFDILFVDEAWQMAWADFMLCGLVSGRFVLIGDPGQIPPTVTVPVQRWETSPRAPHQAAPQLLLDDPSAARLAFVGDLPACRRLPADAVDLVRPFYDFGFEAWARDGERSVDPGRRRGRSNDVDAAIELLAAGSVAAFTIATPAEGPPLEEDMELAHAAARLAARLLERGARAVDGDGGQPERLRPADIGLAATHRVMNAAMTQALPDALRHDVRVDTPERWQGLERKLMIIVHPLSGVTRPSAFDLETGRLCVMASRHRAGMVIVTRDHVPDTLADYVPSAEQAVGRPDVSGRGHHQHYEFWDRLERNGRVAWAA